MRDGYLRGALPSTLTQAQKRALAAYVAAGGSVPEAAQRLGKVGEVTLHGARTTFECAVRIAPFALSKTYYCDSRD